MAGLAGPSKMFIWEEKCHSASFQRSSFSKWPFLHYNEVDDTVFPRGSMAFSFLFQKTSDLLPPGPHPLATTMSSR